MRTGRIACLLTVVGCEWSTVDPSESACEAMCAWAITCHEAERPVDTSALRTACTEATYAVDPTCEDADIDSLSFSGLEELAPCIDAVDQRRSAMECDPFTGTESAIASGTAPAQCIGAGRDAVAVFDAARAATIEPSGALCLRMRDGLCAATEACISEALGGSIPGTVVDKVGEPRQLCAEALADVYVTPCTDDERYTPGLDEPNPARDGARRCLVGLDAPALDTVECDGLYAGGFDPTCAAAFASDSERLAVARALSEVADAFGP